MKAKMKICLVPFFSFLFFNIGIAQEVLPEIVVTAARYKYLSAVDGRELSQPVKMLERRAAEFDVKNSDFYDDEFEEYHISFYIPDGYILASYDKDGKLMHTAERFKNVAIPDNVGRSLVKNYPQWGISKDVYLVTYNEKEGVNKIWKMLLVKGDKRLRVKINQNGDIISR